MKKRFLAIFLAVAMTAGTLPGYCFPAGAAGEDLILEEEADSLAGAEEDVIQEFPEQAEGTTDVYSGAEDVPDVYAGAEDIPDVYTDAEDAPDADSGAEASDPAQDSFVIDLEEVETKNYAAGEGAFETGPEEGAVVYETETGVLEETGLASVASASRSPIMSIAALSYTDSYGAQLSGNAKIVYDRMKDVLLGEAVPGDTEILFANSTPHEVTTYSEEPTVWNENKKTDAGFQAALRDCQYATQSAFDAFAYDYPQAYWLKAPTYTQYVGLTKSNGKITAAAAKIVMKLGGAVLYDGAFSDRAAFRTAVQSAAAEIRNGLPEGSSSREILKAIHDYLCDKITYDYSDGLYAHSAVGVFLKGGLVVCEGYAKAYKILCEQFGMKCALIVGDAGGAHMWNYVQMEDGNWYLVDVTWDDQQSGIRDTYFLAGSGTMGFNGKTIAAERTTYTNFSHSATTTEFTLPVLSGGSYAEANGLSAHTHSWQVKDGHEATCMTAAYWLYGCRGCAESREYKGTSLGPHRFGNYVSDRNATCIRYGTMTGTCIYGCGTKDTVEDPAGGYAPHRFGTYVSNNDKTCWHYGTKTAVCTVEGCTQTDTVEDPESGYAPHRFGEYVSNHDATCMKYGTKTAVCTVEGCTQTDTVEDPAGGYAPHLFEQYVSNHDATCMKYGTKTAECVYGCGTKDTVEDPAGGYAPHRFDQYVSDNNATCQTNGTKTALCAYGCGAADTVEDPESGRKEHLYSSYVSNNDATWEKDGTKTAVCAYCGIRTTVPDPGTKLTPALRLNVSSLTLKTGQTTTAVVVSGLVRGDAVESWTSTNPKIVKVSKKGKITAQKKTGTAYIKVTLTSGKFRKIKVTVQTEEVRTKKITGIAGKLTLKKGKTAKLNPVISPITSRQKVTYTSSNKKVVSVSSSGKIKAKKKGTATIKVKSGSVTVKCKVTVR